MIVNRDNETITVLVTFFLFTMAYAVGKVDFFSSSAGRNWNYFVD